MFLSVLSVFVHQVEQKHRAQTVLGVVWVLKDHINSPK